MNGMFFAERAILAQLQAFGIVLFVFDAVVIPVFALRAFEGHFRPIDSSHVMNFSMQKNHTCSRCVLRVYHNIFGLSTDFAARIPPFFVFMGNLFAFFGKIRAILSAAPQGYRKTLALRQRLLYNTDKRRARPTLL